MQINTLNDLRMPILLVNGQDLIAYANQRAQRSLLDIDVTDMPIECFIVDWALKRPVRSAPIASSIEFIFRDGRYMTVRAAVFLLRFEDSLVSGIAFREPYQATI
ncbi:MULTISPECIES: hypothetical protein [unclassified Rhizobium]|uniref:hypothetical protein n=1 Tax=unclassified Rhizobium TaxID=2613769 RepID=UPI001ADCE331|nr:MULTISPECIES: hypothetical protein [unclassified Rhizobium]MBO9127037.1 hypothetical protein [Rhizobium sp. 16-488-2b]MBO9177484.1 hypothetical protein [Rhizobium sp. 16-488-2a]